MPGGVDSALRVSPAMPNELIVSSEYFPLVRATLDTFGIKSADPQTVDISTELGLTRLLLTAAGAERTFRHADHGDRLLIDKVVGAMRARFYKDYQGWSPPMAVNHVMNHVAVSGEVTFGGDGEIRDAGEVTFGGGGRPATSQEPPWPQRGAGPGHGVRVGVVDTLFVPQPWQAGGWAARYSDQAHDPEPFITSGHATFITGLILHQAPGATVEIRHALDDTGTARVWDVAKEIVAFGRAGVDVLNLSFACYTDDGQPPLALVNAVNRLDPDTVVVAAAGNLAPELNGATPPAWPAAFDKVVAVGAVDHAGGRAPFSPLAPWIDVAALGVDVRSTFLDGRVRVGAGGAGSGSTGAIEEFHGYARWSGTSFAAALVSGTIAAGIQPERITARQSLDDTMAALRACSPRSTHGGGIPYLNVQPPN